MKIITIGDIHGRDSWKKILERENFYKNDATVVFLGDYVDTHKPNITSEMMSANLLEIISLKKNFPDRVHMLLGNHDLHYIGNVSRYSGWSRKTYDLVNPVFLKNLELFEILWKYDNILFSHAGVSEDYLAYQFEDQFNEENLTYDVLIGPLDETRKNVYSPYGLLSALDFNTYTGFDMYGDTTGQGPLWIRPLSLTRNWWKYDKETVQVVGHTSVHKLTEVPCENDDYKLRLFLCDALEDGYYLCIEDDKFIIKNLNETI